MRYVCVKYVRLEDPSAVEDIELAEEIVCTEDIYSDCYSPPCCKLVVTAETVEDLWDFIVRDGRKLMLCGSVAFVDSGGVARVVRVARVGDLRGLAESITEFLIGKKGVGS